MKKFYARQVATILVLLLINACTLPPADHPAARSSPRTFHNPIIPGFHPDPSICRVGDDYYLVNSSFEYFPGVPIFHSKDLVHWQQIGYALDRPSQLNLDAAKPSGGIYAPTIRYHNGTFYLITTHSGGIGNFIITATSPAGPWSEPHLLQGAPGIDPSLFFDDDGTAWYTGNRTPEGGETYPKQRQIWLQQVDLSTFQLIGNKTIIQDGGAIRSASSAEGPHLYKVNGYYYLMIAEGGTGENHAVTISRSKTITGPYEFDPKNPLLTHRNLGRSFPIQCTGHADLVQTQNGDWWMVLLATRPYGGGFDYNLGRETFLAPVIWREAFPIVCPGDGKVELTETAPTLPSHPWPALPAHDDFAPPTLGFAWNFLRTPRSDFYSLTARPGYLRLTLRPEQCTELVNPSWIGRRQEHINFTASTTLDFNPAAENESAGMTAFYNNDYHYRFVKTLVGHQPTLELIQRKAGKEATLADRPIPPGPIDLQISAVGQDYTFSFRSPGGTWKSVATADGRILNRTLGGGFTGAYLAMYATSAGHPSTGHADFQGFTYAPLPLIH